MIRSVPGDDERPLGSKPTPDVVEAGLDVGPRQQVQQEVAHHQVQAVLRHDRTIPSVGTPCPDRQSSALGRAAQSRNCSPTPINADHIDQFVARSPTDEFACKRQREPSVSAAQVSRRGDSRQVQLSKYPRWEGLGRGAVAILEGQARSPIHCRSSGRRDYASRVRQRTLRSRMGIYTRRRSSLRRARTGLRTIASKFRGGSNSASTACSSGTSPVRTETGSVIRVRCRASTYSGLAEGARAQPRASSSRWSSRHLRSGADRRSESEASHGSPSARLVAGHPPDPRTRGRVGPGARDRP